MSINCSSVKGQMIFKITPPKPCGPKVKPLASRVEKNIHKTRKAETDTLNACDIVNVGLFEEPVVPQRLFQ